MIFLDACIFFLCIGATACLIAGHEDAGLLVFGAIVVVVFRLVPEIPAIGDWVRGRVRRDGRKPKRGT